jgi:hypothetical protein
MEVNHVVNDGIVVLEHDQGDLLMMEVHGLNPKKTINSAERLIFT